MVDIEIKAGLELDRAVAEAVGDEPGLPFSIARAERGEEGFTYKPYSMDLNEAFAAAEKVGLFWDAGHILWRGHHSLGGKWFVNHTEFRDEELGEYSIVGRGETPALAICAAILKLRPAHSPKRNLEEWLKSHTVFEARTGNRVPFVATPERLEAANRIRQAIESRETLLIEHDRNVGATALVLAVFSFLCDQGGGPFAIADVNEEYAEDSLRHLKSQYKQRVHVLRRGGRYAAVFVDQLAWHRSECPMSLAMEFSDSIIATSSFEGDDRPDSWEKLKEEWPCVELRG